MVMKGNFRETVRLLFKDDDGDFERLCATAYGVGYRTISSLEIYKTIVKVCHHELYPLYVGLPKRMLFVRALRDHLNVSFFYDSFNYLTFYYIYESRNCENILKHYGVEEMLNHVFLSQLFDIYYNYIPLHVIYQKCRNFFCKYIMLLSDEEFNAIYNKFITDIYIFVCFCVYYGEREDD